MAHPETLLPMPDIEDPVERFISVVKFYLSGWHIKPPYVRFHVQGTPQDIHLRLLIQWGQKTYEPNTR